MQEEGQPQGKRSLGGNLGGVVQEGSSWASAEQRRLDYLRLDEKKGPYMGARRGNGWQIPILVLESWMRWRKCAS